MERLSASLQAVIHNHPLQTIVRSDDKKLDDDYIKIIPVTPTRKVDVPEIFDGRVVWKGLISPVMNQGRCGSCWAFASTGSLGSRFNIQTLGIMNIQLSALKMILCDFHGKELEIDNPLNQIKVSRINREVLQNAACYGSSLLDACRYLFQIGTSTEKCAPYNEQYGEIVHWENVGATTSSSQLPFCSIMFGPYGDMCSDYSYNSTTAVERGTPVRFYKAEHFHGVAGVKADGGSEYDIKTEIYTWGPVMTGMKVYSDFYTFDPITEIYAWDGKAPKIGGHAIELLGWGEKNGEKYWIVKNSWGHEWGMEGYFYMQRGTNMCEIEANVLALVPDLFYPFKHNVVNTRPVEAVSELIQKGAADVAGVSELGVTAGGIDAETGYTRRVMVVMPWINFEKPIHVTDIPDYNTFIAGEHSSVKDRERNQKKIHDLAPSSNPSMNIFLVFSVVLATAIIIVLIIILVKWFKRT